MSATIGTDSAFTTDAHRVSQKPLFGEASASLSRLTDVLRTHLPEYLMEAACLGLFMISACSVVILLEHPSSALRQMIANPLTRRFLIGVAMGSTAIALIYSPWGKQSGAHLNPSTTLTFFRLGKIELWDALFYILAQFIGATIGVVASELLWGQAIAHPSVLYAVTVPGQLGPTVAFIAELTISFVLMMVVLCASNSRHLHRFTGILAGTLVAAYIAIESPLSGMSMNPARTFASAVNGHAWNGIWIYFTAPPIGMLLASESYVRLLGKQNVFCAKLHHENGKRCIFRCNYATLGQSRKEY